MARGAAVAATDQEAGSEMAPGDDAAAAADRARALAALDAMFKRGLIPEPVYRARRAALEAGSGS